MTDNFNGDKKNFRYCFVNVLKNICKHIYSYTYDHSMKCGIKKQKLSKFC